MEMMDTKLYFDNKDFCLFYCSQTNELFIEKRITSIKVVITFLFNKATKGLSRMLEKRI
jgi:hypothetical protein